MTMRTVPWPIALFALVGGSVVAGCNNENFLGTEDGGSAGKNSGGTGVAGGGSSSGGTGTITGGASSSGGAPSGTGAVPAAGAGSGPCGGQVCGADQVCCGPAECGRCIPALSGQACPATCGTGGQGAGGSTSKGGTPSTGGTGGLCGTQVCSSGQVCCGPPQCGICVPEGSDIACPAICVATGGSGAGGAACVAQQGSCANGETCCSGLTCCAGMPVATGQEYCGSICPVSDRNLKTAIEPVNQDSVLERLMSLPVSTWSYRSEGTGVRHLGPMAQDFQAAFGLGASDRTILQVDGDGVALAAIQALSRKFEKLSAENAQMRQRLRQIEEQTAACGAWPAEGKR
jgi:hypothetical protein